MKLKQATRERSPYSYVRMGYANPHAPTSVNGVTHTYDEDGNLTSDGTYTYTWDYQNRLTAVGNGSATTTYAYDHMGNRVKKVEGGVTTLYPNKLYNVTTESSPTATKHIFAGESLVATAETVGTTSSSSITLDATSTSMNASFSAGPVTKTWTHTVSGANPIIILTAAIFQDVAGTGSISTTSPPTWNGGSFTKASSTRMGTKSTELWYLVATTTGAKTMSVTVTGATDDIKLMAASFNGVHQSSPLDAVNGAIGSSGNPSASVTTGTAGDVVVAALHRHTTADATTSQTSLFKDRTSSVLAAASYQLASSTGSYTDTYTGSASQNWSMLIAGFKPAATSGGTTTLRFIHTDHLGGTNVVTDASGLMTQAIDYYPYGDKRTTAGTDVSQREFIGEMYDKTPDLSYLNSRYKNSRGQFMSQDPLFLAIGDPEKMRGIGLGLTQALADPQVFNSYSYARNNPILLKDPNGELFVIPAYYSYIFAVNAVAHLMIDLYDANTSIRQHPNEFGFWTKAGDGGEVLLDVRPLVSALR